MILGVAPTDAFVALPAMTRAQQSSSSDSSDGEDVAAKAREKKRRREHLPAAATAKQPSAKSASVAPPPAEEDHEEEEEGYTAPPAGWWGASMFRWAGRLGGVRRATKQAKGFCEDDQVDAYNNVHDHATHGKQGLGIRDAPKKVAGARWAGTKVSFGDGADTGGVDEDAGDEEGCDAAIAATLRKIKWKARLFALHAARTCTGACRTRYAPSHAPSFLLPFQKLAEAALRARPTGASTLKALRRDVLAAAGVSGAKPLRVAAEVALSRCALLKPVQMLPITLTTRACAALFLCCTQTPAGQPSLCGGGRRCAARRWHGRRRRGRLSSAAMLAGAAHAWRTRASGMRVAQSSAAPWLFSLRPPPRQEAHVEMTRVTNKRMLRCGFKSVWWRGALSHGQPHLDGLPRVLIPLFVLDLRVGKAGW
jgi:hypothetical protein